MLRVLLLAVLSVAAGAQEYKIAVVGMRHSHVWPHLETMLKGTDAKFVGVAESRPEFVERAKRIIPEGLFFTDWKAMIDETKPDVVWAFTETNRHLEVVEYCAPRKVHVMVEKPLAATYQEALEIQALARKYGIQVMTNYGSTWQPSIYAAKTAVDEGAIGPVFRLRTIQGHGGPGDPKKSSFVAWLSDPVKNGGGALVDFGCYGVLWSLWMKGRPESVYASALHLKREMFPQVEDHATIILNYNDGVSIIEGSWDLPPHGPAGSEIYGLAGSVQLNGRKIELRKTAEAQKEAQLEEIAALPLPHERSAPIPYMMHHLRSGEPVEGMSALDLNVAVHEALDAAKESIRTGRSVRLAPVTK